jgi:hypothetical protein
MIIVEQVTFDDLMTVKKGIEQITANMKFATECGFSKPSLREDKSAVFLEGNFKYLSLMAVISPQHIVLQSIGVTDTNDMMQTFLDQHSPCHRDILPFAALVASRTPPERQSLLAKAIADLRHNQ